MKVAIYARVSSEGQKKRGTIGSQVELLRARMAADGHEIVAEFLDNGYSGSRLDRPGLDALRDAAEAGVVETVWCLMPDRLARSYAYQMLVLDDFDRLGCKVHFTVVPEIADDPQAHLLTQMQGVIAEYERRESQSQQQSSSADGGTRRNRYYACSNHHVLRAGGPEHRCTERRIRADELDAFVFDQLGEILLRPEVLLAGERALVDREPTPDDTPAQGAGGHRDQARLRGHGHSWQVWACDA